MRIQCDHYRLAMAHIASLSILPARVRVAQRLIFYARAQRKSGGLANVVRLSQEELASAVGISRQALNVHLKRLEKEGVVSVGYATVEVHRLAALEQLIRQGGGTLNILRNAGDERPPSRRGLRRTP